ncbi:M56 family metallopeptidase [Pedobacter frigiditerrae]|uniref:M56 family metallopeptidase n=1 Tax=Pedobacter frigiditerrae TaxID=2530452 RepID=UPI00292FB47E|nr:M56 family metallopeptidase [Pedobacter frigiditerrae]
MELLYYFLKVSTCTMLFFGFYLVVLRKLTFFKINRFYLLFTLMISFIIPTLHFTVERELSQAPIISTAQFPSDTEISEVGYQTPIIVGNVQALEEKFDYYSLLPYLYLSIVIGLLLVATWRLLQLVKHTRNSVEEVNGLKIVPKAKGFTNCSFFNYVFIDEKSLTETELNILLKHEEVHAKQLHSIDKIILMIIKAVLWFNPIVYLYDKALEEAHEYEADDATSQNFGTSEYAGLLLRLAISKSEMPLVHNFVKSPIKERIKMLFNSKSKNMKKLMYLLALPIGLGLLWGFTVDVVDVLPQIAAHKQDNPKAKKKELALPDVEQTNPYFKSAAYQEQIKKAKSLNGKTLVGTIGADLIPVKDNIFSFNGKYFKVGKETFILTAYAKENTGFKSLKENDEVTVLVDNVGFSHKSDYMQLSAKSISKAGEIVFLKPAPEKYPFLYEANKVRFNDPVITAISNVPNGKALKLKQNGFDFTVNINKSQTDDADYIKSLKVGDIVRLRFVHEVKKGTTSYLINDWISISKNIRTYGLQNESLFYKFYNKDGSQKVAKTRQVTTQKTDIKSSNTISKPKLLSGSTMNVDTKNDITYIKNGVFILSEGKLEGDIMIWDLKNQIIKSKKAKFILNNGDVVIGDSIHYNSKTGKFLVFDVLKEADLLKENKAQFKTLNIQLGDVKHFAQDSTRIDKINQIVYLYGNAKLKYKNIEISSDEMEYHIKDNTVYAKDPMLREGNRFVRRNGFVTCNLLSPHFFNN